MTFNLSDPTLISSTEAEHVMRMVNTLERQPSQVLYYLATSPFLGNKRTAYGQNFSFALSAGVNSLPIQDFFNSTGGDAILEGDFTDFALVVRLPYWPRLDTTSYTFPLREGIWYVNNTDGPRANFTQIMETLSSLKSIKIRAKYSNTLNSYTDLLFVEINQAVNNISSSAPLVNSVEQCYCPPGYTGQFCESCDSGYTVDSLTNQCVPCFCYNHDVITTSCDPRNGSCQCDHNTAGRQCDQCAKGYFGLARVGRSFDCSPCQCPGSLVPMETNVFAQTCARTNQEPCYNCSLTNQISCTNCTEGHTGLLCDTCNVGWFGTPNDVSNNGGRCQRCQCNGRSNTCNSTSGWCTNCTNSTTGRNCEFCATGYYGNAVLEPCKPCSCNSSVGYNGQCDPITGSCKCKPNLTGPRCDVCAVYSFNLTQNGCQSCDCHVTGALSPACNRTSGQCECRQHVTGVKCDRCIDGYFNINLLGCQPCACNPNGTANITGQTFGSCDLVTGQCRCKQPGIVGLKCDRCAKASDKTFRFVEGIYLGSYPDCRLCGDCYDSVAVRIDEVGIAITNLYQQILNLWSLDYNNMTSSQLSATLDSMNNNLTSFYDVLNVTMVLNTQINQLSVDLTKSVDGLLNATMTSQFLISETSKGQQNITTITAFTGVVQSNGISIPQPSSLRQQLQQLTTTHSQLSSAAESAWAMIQTIVNILQQGTSLVDAMRARVTQAVSDSNAAQTMREQAGFLANQTSLTDLFRPRLARVENDLIGLYLALDTVERANQLARNQLDQAGAAIVAADSVMQVKVRDTLTELNAVEANRLNATQALGVVQNTEASVGAFQSLTGLIVDNVTGTMDLLGTSLRTISTVDLQQTNATAVINSVANTQLEPVLRTVENISLAIMGINLPAQKIQGVNQAAAERAAVSSQLVNIAQQASVASNRTLTRLNDVTGRREEAGRIQRVTEQALSATTGYNSSIYSIVNRVQAKANYSSNLAAVTSVAVDDVMRQTAVTQQSYSSQAVRVQTLNMTSLAAQTAANNAFSNHTQNTELANSLQTQLGLRQQLIGRQLTQLQQIENDFRPYSNSVNNLTATLNELERELDTQRNDISQLAANISGLENELQQLLIGLDRLNPQATNCINNNN